MNARLEARLLSAGLLPLSLQHVTGFRNPIALSNSDRLRAWDELRPREAAGNAVTDWHDLVRRVRAAGMTA
jgi:hypothetical protein